VEIHTLDRKMNRYTLDNRTRVDTPDRKDRRSGMSTDRRPANT
jgi:hypothetical protein